jgi:hypothetical protein
LLAAIAPTLANCAAALKGLNSPARKALAEDQRAFISYRDRIAGFDQAFRRTGRTFRSTSSCSTAPPSWPASKSRMLASWACGKASRA